MNLVKELSFFNKLLRNNKLGTYLRCLLKTNFLGIVNQPVISLQTILFKMFTNQVNFFLY